MNPELKVQRRRNRPAAAGRALRRGSAAVRLVFLLVLLGLGAPAAAQSPDAESGPAGTVRDAVLDGGTYQTDRPEAAKLPDIEPWTLPPWLAKALFWIMVAGVATLVAFFLYNLAADLIRNRGAFKRNRARGAEAPERVETPRAEARPVDHRSLAEADDLAAQGRFSEAIHLLLLVALDRLHRELGLRVAPAMTGREVLHLPSLPDATVGPLTRMVQVSEINHFGGRHAEAPDYQSCREEFLRFSDAEPVTS